MAQCLTTSQFGRQPSKFPRGEQCAGSDWVIYESLYQAEEGYSNGVNKIHKEGAPPVPLGPGAASALDGRPSDSVGYQRTRRPVPADAADP